MKSNPVCCPKCGSQSVKINPEAKDNVQAFAGAVCTACGHIVSEREAEKIVKQDKRALKAELLHQFKKTAFK